MNHPGQNAPQFIVVPMTGLQICRRLPLVHLSEDQRATIWKTASFFSEKPPVRNPLLPIIQKHIACDQKVDASNWVACAPNEAVFFRLTRVGSDLFVDLALDTHNGAGRMVGNKVDCCVDTGIWPFVRKHQLASFYVESNHQPRNVLGTLIMDFGNTATSFIFAPHGAAPLNTRPVTLHNPWDPFDGDEEKRPRRDKCILRSTMMLLWVPDSDRIEPWLVLGRRAEELIAIENPLVTSLYAPKKYVRDWPEHLRPQEPTTTCTGLLGQRNGLVPKLQLVQLALKNMLVTAVSSLTNPNFASVTPEIYPQIARVLLTYPLTWRDSDRELFRRLVYGAAEKLFVLPDALREQFRVELVCSEPVAVAAYVLWEVFFHFLSFGTQGSNLLEPSLASGFLGNPDGTRTVRILVLDIGGGSTDIALIEAEWALAEDGASVNVTFQVLESLRFNRAGDRLSHMMATAILEFVRSKYNVPRESLDFATPSSQPAFTLQYKRQVVSRIAELVEAAKGKLSQGSPSWVLEQESEGALASLFQGFVDLGSLEQLASQPPRLEITCAMLRQWLEADQASVKTRGEPGFMDIFNHLAELRESLVLHNQMPHLVILSGRTSRLPFLKEMTARHLQLPMHRVRTLTELLPEALKGPDHADMDKLAVVFGAHRVRFGDPIHFVQRPEESKFRRFVGFVAETMSGLRLNRILAEPGESWPKTVQARLPASSTVLIGHSFRRESNRAEVIAILTNYDAEPRDVEIDLENDYCVRMKRVKGNERVVLTEKVPGGNDIIVDNFNDTGRIDEEPPGWLRSIVSTDFDSKRKR
ncbi:MAG: hypothetical protein RMJ52_17630 [Gemmataceae bacterium]|nr:hypothetical protein [Gemmataceae bacterium]